MSSPATSIDLQFLASIGSLTLAWGQLEGAIDGFVGLLHWHVGGQQIERVMPWQLSRKIEYIKKCFRKIPVLQPSAQLACDIMDKIDEASEIRHDLIHGYVVEKMQGVGEAKLLRLLRPKKGETFRQKPIHVTTAIVIEHTNTALQLTRDATALLFVLARHFTDYVPDEPSSEIKN
jgi:hypothetical protein